MLITICDVLEKRRDDVEWAGGEVRRTWNGLMDVQFNTHTLFADRQGNVIIRNNNGAFFEVSNSGYSNIYIQ